MSIVIDVALVLTFALFVISFTKNGFAGSIIKIGKGWISLFFSFVLNPFVTDRLHEWVLCRPITNGINNTLVTLLETNPNGYSLSQLFERLPQGFVGLLSNFDINLKVLEAEYGSSTEATKEILADIACQQTSHIEFTKKYLPNTVKQFYKIMKG